MATMADVARLANVSLSTVSYALSGSRPISAQTAERVRRAADQLGYRRNRLASGLAGARKNILALALPVARVGFSATIFEFVAAASTAAAERGYRLVLWPASAEDPSAVEDLAKEGLVDGVILMEVTLNDARVAVLEKAGLPYVMIGRTANPERAHFVDIDFAATVERALDTLQAEGHSAIHLVTHSRASLRAGYGPVVRVSESFDDMAAARGLASTTHYCAESAAEGRRLADTLCGLASPPTALVVMNEEASFGLVGQFVRRGVGVPADVSMLAIVSSHGVAERMSPVLTTLEAPTAELGAAAFQALFALLSGDEEAGGVLVACRDAPGESVGPARTGPLPHMTLNERMDHR